jgi:hypothetical protein
VSGGRGCGDLCWVCRFVQQPAFAGLAFASVAFLLSWDYVGDNENSNGGIIL